VCAGAWGVSLMDATRRVNATCKRAKSRLSSGKQANPFVEFEDWIAIANTTETKIVQRQQKAGVHEERVQTGDLCMGPVVDSWAAGGKWADVCGVEN
jgi:hypothetical protein